jgi:hypothetical protein
VPHEESLPKDHEGMRRSNHQEQDGALGNVVLVISGVPEAAVADFEWSHTGPRRSFREFVVPAQILDHFPTVGIYPDTWLWLSGTSGRDGHYFVNIGEKRRLARRLLAKKKVIAKEHPLRCMLLSHATLARSASLKTSCSMRSGNCTPRTACSAEDIETPRPRAVCMPVRRTD